MPRSAWGMLRTLFLLALVACSSKSKLDDKPAAPKDASTAPKSVDIAPRVPVLPEPAIELPKLDSFTLIAPGKGPLALLRYKLAAGTATEHAESRLRPRQLVNGTWSKPVELPAIRDGFSFAIDADPKKPLVGRPLAGEIVGTATPAADQYLAAWRMLENRRFSV